MIVIYVHYVLPNRTMMEDYEHASSPLPYTAAVEDLGRRQNARATELLLKIAQNPAAFPQNRQFAILALAKRGNVSTTNSLAELLRPGEALAIQLAIVGSLLDRDCQRQCVRPVIEYFKRLYNGESMPHPMTHSPDVSQSFENDRQEILRLAKDLLTKNKSRTIEVLHDEYGLGTAAPSPFVSTLLSDLRLVEACSLLLQSYDLLQLENKPLLSRDVRSTINDLNCMHLSR